LAAGKLESLPHDEMRHSYTSGEAGVMIKPGASQRR